MDEVLRRNQIPLVGEPAAAFRRLSRPAKRKPRRRS
jgi:hypothetical protein